MRTILLSLVAAALLPLAASVPPVAQAQQATQQPPQITEFQKIEDQWSAALVKQDQFTLETILSPTFVDISSEGEITTRNQQVADMYEKGEPQPVMLEHRVVNVRLIEDVAIVDGTYFERSKLNGVEREERGVFTHIYQHVREVWVCVQSQRTAVVEQMPEKKKQGKKKSDAELPFHIPLLHKGAESTQQPSSQTTSQP
ncbi:MAG: nuclear transport factor 2 family protein [Silvibacterium sp.]